MRKKITIIYTSVVLIFFLLAGLKLDFFRQSETISYWTLTGLLIIQVSSLLLIPLAWYLLLLIFTSKTISKKEVYAVYAKSWMGRYLPGKVTWVVGRLLYGDKIGISNKKMTAVSVLEILLSLTVTALVATPAALILFSELISNLALPGLLALVLFSAVSIVILRIVRRSHNLTQQLVRLREETKFTKLAGAVRIVFSSLILVFAFIISALHFPILIYYFNPEVELNAIYLVSLYFLANFLGMVAFFAPVGIGIKEAVLTSGLLLSGSSISIGSVLVYSRMITLIADVVFYSSGKMVDYILHSKK